MKTSCITKPQIKNKEGKYEDSRLFDSLLSLFDKNRNEAKKHYFIATHKEFLDAFRDELKFDELGEVTLESYLKATQSKEGELKFLEYINKIFESGEYDVETAISKAQTFSKGEYKDNYIPRFTWKEGNKVHIEIVKKDANSENDLKNFYKQRNLIKRIINALRNAGVNVQFLEDSTGRKGRYSTENVEQTYDGLYNLISIFEGRNVSDTLAEEAGHFVYAAMQGNPLITRLNNALTEEVIDSYASELELYNKAEEKTELAGRLIGKALLKKQEGPLANLLDRIVHAGKKLFAKITSNKLQQLKLEAEEVANLAAENFLSPNFEGSVDVALERKETLYSKESTTSTQTFAELKAKLKLYKKRLSAINYSVKKRAKEIDKTLSDSVGKLYRSDAPVWRDFWATRGILDSLTMLIGDYESIREKLENIDTTKKELHYRDLDIIKEGRVFVNTASDIIKFAEEYLSKIHDEGTVIEEHKQIEKVLKQLKNLVTEFNYTNPDIKENESNAESSPKTFKSLRLKVQELELHAYTTFLEKMYGSSYITRTKRVLLDGLKIRKFRGPKNEDEWNEALRDYLTAEYESLYEEDSMFAYVFHAFQNIKDPTMSIFNDMVRQARRYANQSTLLVKTQLLDLYDKLYELQHGAKVLDAVRNPVDAGVYYETFEDGSFTGNIMRPVLYGWWERDYEEFKAKCIKDFEESLKGKRITTYERGQKWVEFFGPKEAEWHAQHSIKEIIKTESGVEIPNYKPSIGGTYEDRFGRVYIQKNYINEKWYQLSREEQAWIDSYVDLKSQLDKNLGREGHTRPYRLPQFRGDAIERVKTALQQEESKIGGATKAIGEVISEQWSLTSEDIDYGSDLHYSSVEDDFLDDTGGGQYGETVNRLPLYGINKLEDVTYTVLDDAGNIVGTFKNRREAESWIRETGKSFTDYRITQNRTSATHRLSRDLFHSTLLYAEMTHKYKALREVEYAASMVQGIYKDRHEAYGDKKIKTSHKRGAFDVRKYGFMSSYGRFTSFVDKALYGKYSHTKIGKFSVNKFMSLLGNIGSKLMLGGNLVVGFKDLAGKLNGILREAHIEEFVSAESVGKAFAWYFKYCVPHMLNFANDKAQDEISAFKEYFNVSDTFDSLTHEFDPQKSYIRKFLNQCIWSPLAISASCEVIVYAALAFDTKVQDVETQEIMSLMDIYERDKLNPDSESKRKMLVNTRPALRSLEPEAYNQYMLYTSIITKLEEYLSKPKDERDDDAFEASLTEEEKNLIYSYSEKTRETPNKVLNALYDDRSNLTINTLYENVVVESKARVILNNIAGIYNFLDRSAFQDSFLGVAALSMKGWFSGMVAQAGLNSARYSPILKSEQEGFFTSILKFIVDVCTPVNEDNDATDMKILMKAIGSTLPLARFVCNKEECKQDLIDAGYTKNQYNNLARWVDSMFSIAVLQGLQMLFKFLALKAVGGDDDKEDEEITIKNRKWYRFWGVLHYLMKATKNEFLGVYWPPLAFKQAMNFTSINAFTPIAGVVKLGELMGLGALEGIEALNNWVNPNDDVWKEIHKGNKQGIKGWLTGKHNVNYDRYNIDVTDTSLWKEIKNKEGKVTGYMMIPDGTWNALLRKEEKTGEIKYRNLQVPERDDKGNIVFDPVTGEPKYKAYKHNDKYTIKVPVFKSEYAQAVTPSGVRGGDSRLAEKLEKITPVIRHRDVLRDPISAAENLQVVWDKNKK